jgi:hypothetical protein
MRYQEIQSAIFQVFATPAWKAELIETLPVNFTIPSGVDYFIRVNILPSGRGVNRISASGLVIINIHIRDGNGPSKAVEIADRLDAYLMTKSFTTASGTVQFNTSSFAAKSRSDALNFAVFEYSIPFNFFGVL